MWCNRIRFHANIIPQFTSLIFQRKLSNDLSKFKQHLKTAKEIVVLSGAGISVESGIPTFREQDDLWRSLPSTILFSASTFRDDPSLSWEFFHYSRELALNAKPNAGHMAIAEYEAKHVADKKVTVITQNVDGLHAKAGSKNIVELHGSLFKTRCTICNEVLVNTDSPICEALRGSGSPTSKLLYSNIPQKDLPRCKKPNCGGLLRPHIIFYGEQIELAVVEEIDPVITKCDMLLVVGTSSMVYPAAAFPTVMAAGGSIVTEFNIEPAPASTMFDFYFAGPSASTLPQALQE